MFALTSGPSHLPPPLLHHQAWTDSEQLGGFTDSGRGIRRTGGSDGVNEGPLLRDRGGSALVPSK